MPYHLEKQDPRFGRKVYYAGNQQWNSKYETRQIFESESNARLENNKVRGTIVEE
jgi:hypothetical protein